MLACVKGAKTAQGHKLYHEVLRRLRVGRPNQV